MILILKPSIRPSSDEYQYLMSYLHNLPNIQLRLHHEQGHEVSLTEVHLIGTTNQLSVEEMRRLPAVQSVVRVSERYRVMGRHKNDNRPASFQYNGVDFSQDNLNIFAGLCAVDTRECVEQMMKAVRDNGQVCTRMGAYKPRTSPYAFQGHGKQCLPYVFELAGKYGIKIVVMEVTHESHVAEIHEALHRTGHPTGVMLQIGTRNTQNFELLKTVGRQQNYPVLLKRGYGISLDESLHAAEYLASEGNQKIVFGLRGIKSNLGDPHRNLVDFAHVAVVKRLTRMPVCVDPSHAVGSREQTPDGILDLMHATAQGVIAGANMVLVDFHPSPSTALVDGPQALPIELLPQFIEDVQIVHETYQKRRELARRYDDEALKYEAAAVVV
jgi:3-deoxy-7-phosphoheptulonate synthase